MIEIEIVDQVEVVGETRSGVHIDTVAEPLHIIIYDNDCKTAVSTAVSTALECNYYLISSYRIHSRCVCHHN